ncbi:MAG TPA: glycosyltransferase [Caproiciproducens sp.]|nr:glycosyltransferase [Caproiciproducens sp.]
MGKYKICVYAICKNEEQFVDRWMDAVKEADLVVVTDTGSTDRTVEKLRGRGAVVYEEKIQPWRFDTARNIAMDHVPHDVDICVSNDLDEIFEPGWRQKLESAWQPYYTRAKYLFNWSGGSDGSGGKQFVMEKIHRRDGFRWVHPVHEVLRYTGQDPDRPVWVDGLVLNHDPDLSKPRSQYLPLLELSARENPDDDRVAFWLGREYMYYGKYDDCIRTLTEYLKMPTALWNEERCAAMRFIADCYREKGDRFSARVWLFRAVAECPTIREPYLAMARLGYLENDWPLVFLMVTDALKITVKSGSYLFEPDGWGAALYDLGAICCYWLGLYRQSYAYAETACGMEPNDPRLKRNLELIKAKLDASES